MYVIGLTSTSRGPPSRAGPRPPRPRPAGAGRTWRRSASASRSATMKPTLCRLPAYSGPGLPSPTTSQGADSHDDLPTTTGRLRHNRGPGRSCRRGATGTPGRPRVRRLERPRLGPSPSRLRRPRRRLLGRLGGRRGGRSPATTSPGRQPARRRPAADVSPAVTWVPASRPSIDTSKARAAGSPRRRPTAGCCSCITSGVPGRLADQVHRHLDGDLLAPAHDEQVDVLDRCP